MGQKPVKFECHQWNDGTARWVPVQLEVSETGQLLSHNSKSGSFILGVNLSTAYKLLAFGPLCSKLTDLPPIPDGKPEDNLLGIPTSAASLKDLQKISWFLFKESATMRSVLETILKKLDALQVQRRHFEKYSRKTNAEGDGDKAKNKEEVNADLSTWYGEGFGCGWCVGSARVTDPDCFVRESANKTVVIDINLCTDAITSSSWGSNCGFSWDTTGQCMQFDSNTKSFVTTNSLSEFSS